MPKLATPNFRQATESVVSKNEATLVASFGKKMSLWRVGQGAKKVWHAIVTAVNQTHA
jgi:hypothetical protein